MRASSACTVLSGIVAPRGARLHLLLGVEVVLEHVDVRDEVEGQRVREDLPARARRSRALHTLRERARTHALYTNMGRCEALAAREAVAGGVFE